MSDLDPMTSPEETPVSRRNVLRLGVAGAAVAWSVPVILTLQASPAGAASAPPGGSTTPGEPRPTTGSTEPEGIQPTQPEGSGPPPQPFGPPETGGSVKPETVTVTPPTATPRSETSTPTPTTTDSEVRGEAVQSTPATVPSNGGLAFTGAEIGGLVVLGTGAVALGTAAVWSARHRDEDDLPT